MTKINELVSSPVLSDDDLFVIWFSGSGRTRSVSGKLVRDTLLSKGFNPDAFVSGRIDTNDEKLYLTQQRGNEVEIGPVISFLSNHKIEELANVPSLVANNFLKVTPDGSSITYYDLSTLKIEELANVGDLEANKLLKVNSAGDAVIYADPFDLSLHKIEELKNVPTLVANKYLRVSTDGTAIEYHDSDISTEKISDLSDVPAIEALKFLRGTADGSATEWIASSSGNEIGVEKGGTALGTVHTLNFDNLFGVAVANDKATITPDGLATKTDLNPLATKAELNKYVLLAPTTKQEVDGLKTLFTTQLISQSTDKSHRFNLSVQNDGTMDGVVGLADGSDDKNWIRCNPNGSTQLYYNDSKVVETNNDGVTIGSLANKKLLITTDSTGAFFGFGSKPSIVARENGATELYYNGAKTVESTEYGFDLYHNGNTSGDRLRIFNNLDSQFMDAGITIKDSAGVEQHIITGKKSGATELYHNGNLSFSVVGQGYTANLGVDGSWFDCRSSGGTTRIYTNKEGNGSLIQADPDGRHEKIWVGFYRNAGVTFHYNDIQQMATTNHGVVIDNAVGTFNDVYLRSPNRLHGSSLNVGNDGAAKIPHLLNGTWHDKIVYWNNNTASLMGTWHGTVTPSDATLKNANPIGGLDKLNLLEPIEWTWSDPVSHQGGEQGEPIAGQEQPETPAGGDSGDSVPDHKTYQGFTAQSYQKLFPHLIEEIQPEDIPAGIPNAGSPILGIKKDITGHEMDALLVDSIQTLNKTIVDLNARVGAMENGMRDDINLLQSLSDSVFSRVNDVEAKIAKLEGTGTDTSTDGGST